MGYEAIIFDLDGVICSTDEYHYQAWKALADSRGIPFDRETNEQLRGISRRESLEIILRAVPQRRISEEEKRNWTEEKNNLYREMLKQMTREDLSREVKQTLDTLRQQGCKLAIGSSSANAPFILSRLGLETYFDAVSCGLDIQNTKPHPEVFLLAAQRLGMKPEQCLVVEDAQAGIEAAARGGMDSAAMGDARNNPKHTYSLNRFSDLLHIVNKGGQHEET